MMVIYILQLKDEETGNYHLSEDEFLTNDKDQWIRMPSIFTSKTEAYKYINHWGYRDEDFILSEQII